MPSPGPIMLDASGAFMGPDRDALLRRHGRYGRAFAAVTASEDAALNIVVPRSYRGSARLATTTPHLTITAGFPQFDPRFIVSPPKHPFSGPWSGMWIASDPFTTGPLQLFAARRSGTRLQVQVHGDFGLQAALEHTPRHRAKMAVARRVLRAADSIRVVSQAQGASIASEFALDPAKILVAHVPLDEVFLNTPIDESARRKKVLFVGRLHEERGLEAWANTAHEIASRDPAAQFGIVGAGPSESDFRRMLQGLAVTWHGRLSPAAVAELMGRSQVLLSTPQFESYGRSLVEGLCMGMKVVATETTGAGRLAAEPDVVVTSDPVLLADATVAAMHAAREDQVGVEEFRTRQAALDDAAIDRLARSWA